MSETEKYLRPSTRQLINKLNEELDKLSDEELNDLKSEDIDGDDDCLFSDDDFMLLPDLDTSVDLLKKIITAIEKNNVEEMKILTEQSKTFLEGIGVKMETNDNET